MQALKRQRDLLVAGHRAAILAIGRIGGMKAWREYFADYSAALHGLKELSALPEAEVVQIAADKELGAQSSGSMSNHASAVAGSRPLSKDL